MSYNKCLLFISQQEKITCQHVRHISVSNTILRHKGPFRLIMFPWSINSSKFPIEVLHIKIDLPYFVQEMFKIWQAKSGNMSKNGENRWFGYLAN